MHIFGQNLGVGGYSLGGGVHWMVGSLDRGGEEVLLTCRFQIFEFFKTNLTLYSWVQLKTRTISLKGFNIYDTF